MYGTAEYAWARDEFGAAKLGDARRLDRVIRMAARAAEHPAGGILEVFRTSAERQGSYDLVENDEVAPERLMDAIAARTVERCAAHPYVFVPIDGTSLSLVDHGGAKDFGSIGSHKGRGRGLKVIDAMAVSPEGCPEGLLALQWWVREPKQTETPHYNRPLRKRETRHWHEAVESVRQAFEGARSSTKLWFQLDRESDSWTTLEKLEQSGHWFTVRSAHNRRVCGNSVKPRFLHDIWAKLKRSWSYELTLKRTQTRGSRKAILQVSATTVTLDIEDPWSKRKRTQTVNAVRVVETRNPDGEAPLHWVLLTNHPIGTREQIEKVIYGYTLRWRIEDFHRTWKKGGCNVEQTQLRSTRAVERWATILAAVAMRIERLKHLSRTDPDLPATVELSDSEIMALLLLKRRDKKKNEVVPDAIPTIGQAVRWIADLGGYTGPKTSGGPPGSITINRGFLDVVAAARAIDALKNEGKLR
jgi:hypothetical protein